MLNIIVVIQNCTRNLTITITLYYCDIGYVMDMWLMDMGFYRVFLRAKILPKTVSDKLEKAKGYFFTCTFFFQSR